MCGIVGYAGNVETACGKPLEVCLQGLERLEYRGYDSAGVALTAPGMDKVTVRKKAGRLKNLVEDIERKPMPLATVGIGHTRWATNGEPNDVNAHPHTSMDGKVAIIHNGIIENASQLRLDLQAEGYRFASATDTEVAAKLLGKIVDKIIAEEGKPNLFKAVRRMARMLEGAFTILATDCRQPISWSAPVMILRWLWALAMARTSSAPMWPHSWHIPNAPWKSIRIRPCAYPPIRSLLPTSTAM